MKEMFLTRPQREALDKLVHAGGVVFANKKKDGFEGLRANGAIALLFVGAAAIHRECGTLELTPLGQILTGKDPRTEKPLTAHQQSQLVNSFVERSPEYP
jgi:hypothetical protein